MNWWKVRARLRLAGPIPSETIRITNRGFEDMRFAVRKVTRTSNVRTMDKVMKKASKLDRTVRRRKRGGSRPAAASSRSSSSVSSGGTRLYEWFEELMNVEVWRRAELEWGADRCLDYS